MVIATGVVWLALTVTGIGLGGCGAEPRTDLTIEVANAWGHQTYRLTCEPVGGDVPDARRLCDLLAANAAVMLSSPDDASTCFGGLSTVHLAVYGRFDGRIVEATAIDACSGNVKAEQLWLSQLPPPPEN